MPGDLFGRWCESRKLDVAVGKSLHVFSEKVGGRGQVEDDLNQTVISHYENPVYFNERMARTGFPFAAQVLNELLPQTRRARSGHLGEILATEIAPTILGAFHIPIKRLRWTDGRESALRGEDLVGIDLSQMPPRFLKGESKSRASLDSATVANARTALDANEGRPSQHTMGFIMRILNDFGQEALARVFEEHMVVKTIPPEKLVHLTFTLSGNDGSATLRAALDNYSGKIEQHSVSMRIRDHQQFIAATYNRMTSRAP